jgi:DNA-binding phage protein
MALTRDFKETVKARADLDPEFRNELLTEALEAIVCGEGEVAKVLLRDYINATVGFESVGKAVDKDPKSLMRMLSKSGNPNVNNLFRVTRFLQENAGVKFSVVSAKRDNSRKRKLVNCQ